MFLLGHVHHQLADLPWGAVLWLGGTVLGVGAAKPARLRTAATGTHSAVTLR